MSTNHQVDLSFATPTLLNGLSWHNVDPVKCAASKVSNAGRRISIRMTTVQSSRSDAGASDSSSSSIPPSSSEEGGLVNPFCAKCGTRTEWVKPEHDERYRHVCPNCSTVAYENPKVVVGCVPVTPDGERVLLVRRAIFPVGKWTVPAGFMELDETAHAGAAREAMEEAHANVDLSTPSLLAMYNILPAKQVQLLFWATLLNEDDVRPGIESLEVGLFRWDEIPEDSDLAFPTISWALDYARGHRHSPIVQPDIRTR